MNEMQQKVHEFLLKHLGAAPSGWPNKTGTYNKWMLIKEEFDELTEALNITDVDAEGHPEPCAPPNEPETVDGICDLLYVIFNLCEELELDIEPFYNEVHRSNMTKIPASLSPNKKVQKGPHFVAPRIRALLAAVREGKRFCPTCSGMGVLRLGAGSDEIVACPEKCEWGLVPA